MYGTLDNPVFNGQNLAFSAWPFLERKQSILVSGHTWAGGITMSVAESAIAMAFRDKQRVIESFE